MRAIVEPSGGRDASLMERPDIAISLVERGWRARRECAGLMAAEGVSVTHLVRGHVGREVRAVIQLRPGECLLSAPRQVYGVARWLLLWWAATRRRVRWVLVDNERTLRYVGWWCRRFGWTSVLTQEIDNRLMCLVDGREEPVAAIVGRRDRDAGGTDL